MNYQKKTPPEVLEMMEKKGIKYFDVDYYAFPETFGSTSGPCGGIGGCSMTTFTVEAYVFNGTGPTVYVCSGKYKFKDEKYKARWY